jgi:hypothetical protein
MLITQSGNFQNFEFESLAGISSNTWQTKIGRNRFHCELHCSSSLKPCRHAGGHPRGRPRRPLPRPKPCDMGGMGGHRPDPLSSPSPSLQAPDHHDRARADPQPSAAETAPLQHAPEAVVPGVAFAHRQGPDTSQTYL